jgi:hypothetical protein
MKRNIEDIPARELMEELIRRLGVAETRLRLGVPASTDLRKLADELDEGSAR